MKNNFFNRRGFAALSLTAFLAVTGQGALFVGGRKAAEAAPEQNEPAAILVAAAASLKNAYDGELIPLFQAKYPWITVTGTYDSSGKLQTQIENGLEADVFMSAAVR